MSAAQHEAINQLKQSAATDIDDLLDSDLPVREASSREGELRMLHPHRALSEVWNGFGAPIEPSIFASFLRVTRLAWRFARNFHVRARWDRFAAHDDEIPRVCLIPKQIAWPTS